MNKSVSIHNVIPLAVIALLCICLVISASSLATATTLDSNNEVGGKVVCSERYMKIQMAEKAIKDKYRITPEMYTFFTREVTSSGNSITVTLTGANKFYYVLGVYTATSDGITSNATWSNDGMETYGGFDAPAWEALQLKQMILLFRDKDEVNDIYEKANLVAKTYDPIYSEPTEYTELINEHEFELTAHHLTDAEINAMCKLSNEEMNIMAIDAINEIYGYDTSVLQFVDTEPNFRYVLEDDKLIYRAWLYVSNGIDNGQFLVMIDAETGMIEDMVYDSKLESIG